MKRFMQALKEKGIECRGYYTGSKLEFVEVIIGSKSLVITPTASQYIVEQKGDKPKKCKTEKEITKLLNTCL